MTRPTILSVLAAVAMLALGCGGDNKPEQPSADVFVDIAPLAFFVNTISGGEVSCEILVPAGQEPHTYQLTARQAARLGGCKLFIHSGLPFARRIAGKIHDAPDAPRIADLSEQVDLIAAGEAAEHHEHAHESEDHDSADKHDEHADHDVDHEADDHDAGEEHAHEADDHEGHGHHHDHGGLDPHFWVSPRNALVMTDAILEELVALRPQQAEAFRANAASLRQRLVELDRRLGEALRPLAGRSFYVFHPAFGYFARDYQLRQEAIEFEGKSPSPRRVAALIESARREGVKVIFVQPQFPAAAATTLAEQIDGTVVALDPLADNYIANLEDVADRLAEALGEAPNTTQDKAP